MQRLHHCRHLCPISRKLRHVKVLRRPLRNSATLQSQRRHCRKSAPINPSLPAPVYWLTLGAFAIGTAGFMISPLLPGLATDLSVTIETAGRLVNVFALAYGISSPVLTALSGNVNRRTLSFACMIAFAVSNLLALASPTFWALMGALVLLVLSAGLYVPGANACRAELPAISL
ncbi:MFS transporter [Paraburkholderia sediminicola]|uniref:MFS transporter n=1 Tax=Paraburkholderia sediminicola TaxID=458836 RepID=UPI0038B753D5